MMACVADTGLFIERGGGRPQDGNARKLDKILISHVKTKIVTIANIRLHIEGSQDQNIMQRSIIYRIIYISDNSVILLSLKSELYSSNPRLGLNV